MDAPSGLNLKPEPPPTVRVSKRAGIAVGLVLTVILGLFAYGGYKRQLHQEAVLADNAPKDVTPATAAGTEITKDIPSGNVLTAGRKEGAELRPPEEPPFGDRPVVRRPHPSVQPVAAFQQHEPTLQERQLALAYEREQQALMAPTTIGQSAGLGTGISRLPQSMPSAGSTGDVDRVAALARALGGSPGLNAAAGNTGVKDSGEYSEQNGQSRKEAFFSKARPAAADSYLRSARTAPLSKYEIKAGWEIPALMEQGLNSDLPGEVKALVASDVFDTATGRYLLIPQGCRLVGVYDSHVGYGQDGVQVVWNRIIFPDGSSIDLSGMAGQDSHGYSGFRHTVDRHYRRLVAFAVLTSLFSAGFELSQRRNRSVLTYPSTGEIAAGAIGREATELGAQVTRRNLNVQPTIKIPLGYKFNVRVNRDILFEAPYEPFQAIGQ